MVTEVNNDSIFLKNSSERTYYYYLCHISLLENAGHQQDTFTLPIIRPYLLLKQVGADLKRILIK